MAAKKAKKRTRSTNLKRAIRGYEDEVIQILLEKDFWPTSLEADKMYIRRSDDDDGLGNHIDVMIAGGGLRGGDVFLSSYMHEESLSHGHCFRNGLGGGNSPRVRNALLMLAIAIKLDEADRPFRLPAPDRP